MVIQQNRYIQAAQQLIRLWSGARGARAGPVDTVRAELESLARGVGLDLELAHRLTPESLELLLAPAEPVDPLRAWLLAELFYVSGRLSEQAGENAAARESDRRALHLYERIEVDRLPELDLPDPRTRAAELGHRAGGGEDLDAGPDRET
jgi:hypothetical protein